MRARRCRTGDGGAGPAPILLWRERASWDREVRAPFRLPDARNRIWKIWPEGLAPAHPKGVSRSLMAELELRHLRAVCAIADEGSVTKAAARLGLTQPALSAQLRSVERLVGGQLFERTPAG